MRTPTLPLIAAALLVAAHVHGQTTCATAPLISDGTHQVSQVVGEAPPMACTGGPVASHGMWYRYTTTEAINLTVSTSLPENVGRDTRIQIFSGTCGSLTCVGGDDDSGSGFLSVATVGMPAGATYYIVFDDRWDAHPFTVHISSEEGSPWSNNLTFTPQSVTGHSLHGVVDMNNDGLDDLVSVNGSTSVLIGFQQPEGGFQNVSMTTPPAMHQPSWSFCVGDINGDRLNDMLYGGGSGATFMIRTPDGTAFTQQPFAQYIFCQRTNMVDINNDGHLDAFSCHDVQANVRFMNDGTGQLQFIQGGLGETCGNYGSIWTDINNDGLPDLFVAKCGCDPMDRMIFNLGEGQFQDVSAQNNLLDSHQSWSSAWGDFDNDGDMDVLIGSSTSNVHKLMRNDGAGNFTLIPTNFMETTGTIEWVTHDFNNDGYLDLMGGGRILLGNGDMTFSTLVTPVTNGAVGDLNNDGFLDYAVGNTVYFNNGNENHWLKVVPQGQFSNTNGIGARITVESALGSQIRDIRSGDGFRYMSTLYAHFGLGQDSLIDRVTISWPSGVVDVYENLPVDTTLTVLEGSTLGTGIATLATVGPRLHPNPTNGTLYVGHEGAHVGKAYRIFDAAGQLVQEDRLRTDAIDVSKLQSGVYTLQLVGEEGASRFVKQ